MKNNLMLLSVLTALAACNGGIGEKERTLARIDGKAFTEEELDLRLYTFSDEQREAILANAEQRRDNFENILRNHIYSLAAQSAGIGNRDSLEHRLAIIDQRVMTQYYFEVYINEYGGHTRKEVEEFYRGNPSRFLDDSGKTLPFSKVISRVSDSLLLSHVNIDSFYQANRNNYLIRARCDASLIQTPKLKYAQAALKAVKGGMSFGDAAAKYSKHASKGIQGRLGRINKGEGNLDIGTTPTVDSLLFDSGTRLKPGEVSNPLPKDSVFILVRSDSCVEEQLPPLASLRSQVAGDLIREYKSKMSENAIAALKSKYKAHQVSPYKAPTEEEIKTYYEQNNSDYESPETYELYDIETSAKDKLAGRLKAVKELNGFKTLASQVSENPSIKAQGGYVGVVKRDYCLPYGIGLLPALFPALDTMNSGRVKDPVQSSDNQKWHFFWLVKKNPRALKPLERVHALVKSDLGANRVTNVKPEDTVAVFGDGRVFREKDVLFLKEEIPPQMRERYTRESLVDYMLTWQLSSDEAKSLGLTDEKRLIALRLQNEDGFWGRLYQESVMTRSYEEDTLLLAKTFTEKRGLFTRDTTDRDWQKYTHDVAAYLTLVSQDFNIEYYTNPEHYQRDTVLPELSSVMYEVFQNLKPLGYQRLEQKILEKLKARFQVRVVDADLTPPSLEPAAESYKKAQNLHYDRKLDQALNLYGKLREKFPDRSDLQDSICFGIAQIYIEQERYQQALAEYRRVSYLYPKSGNNYKAMFMIGFIYSEHLKNDSSAVRAFEKMLAKYPNTDLSDDADWMIRNIRSGGKLMPTLEGDSASATPEADKPKK